MRCYYLDFDGKSIFSEGVYICKLTGQEMSVNDPKVKFTCNPDCGENYKNCPVYKSTR